MNKQEAVEIIEQSTIKIAKNKDVNCKEDVIKVKSELVDYAPLEIVVNTINKIHEPQKVVVPQVAVEYYYTYKDCYYSLGELLSDFYSDSAREEFPRLDELAAWLHDNDLATTRQRELALATLIVNGPDAVEIEQEQSALTVVSLSILYHKGDRE
ncbi:hypothetical protein [Streptococcus suis]